MSEPLAHEIDPAYAPAGPRAVAARGGRGASLADLVALVKPTIMMMSLVTAAGAMALAPGDPGPGALLAALVGIGMLVGSANTLNMYLERDVDCLMARTKRRPLPSGRMDPAIALAFGIAQAVVAVPLLTFALNPLTGLVGVAALIGYVMLYTPLKQRSTVAILIGAFPGAAPALMGWTAATGHIDAAGLAVFGILFLWQIPHFHAISLFRRKDYHRAGLQILPVKIGDAATRRVIVAYLVAQVAVSLAVVPLGVAGSVYLIIAAVLGAGYLGYALLGLRADAGPRWARNLFIASNLYLPVLFTALVLGGLGG
jgi:protoheme IX farnesyltransferase